MTPTAPPKKAETTADSRILLKTHCFQFENLQVAKSGPKCGRERRFEGDFQKNRQTLKSNSWLKADKGRMKGSEKLCQGTHQCGQAFTYSFGLGLQTW